MKKLCKVLMFCVCFIGLMTISSKSVSASDGWGTCGDNIKWTFTESTGVLKLEGSGEMKGEKAWKSYYKEIKKVIIGEGITSVSALAFSDPTWGASAFPKLKEVQLPSTLKVIEYGAFRYAKELKSISLPKGLTQIGDSAFRGSGLVEIEIPASINELSSGAFASCSNLASIKLPEGLQRIGDSCFYNTNITTIEIPTSVVEIGESAFEKCENLRYVTVSVSLEGSVFSKCSSLEAVRLADGVETIGKYCFYECTNLSVVYIPESVKEIPTWGDAFSGTTPTFYGYPGSAAYDYAGKNSKVNFVDVSTAAGKKEWETLWDACVNGMEGDLDGNKIIELADAQIALKAALKIIKTDATIAKAADVDGNGEVALSDAQQILKYALKIINRL